MNDYPPFRNRGGTFLDPAYHHGGPSALAWTIFALQLVLLLGLATLLVSALAGPRLRPLARPFPGPSRPPGGPNPDRPDPLETVRMRYARGELSRDDYLQATRDLGGTPADEAPTAEPGSTT
jgi:hypothetical protein